jgi:hypothetical protein
MHLLRMWHRAPCGARNAAVFRYVHQCPRMSYKREYRPSEVACPVHSRWVPLDAVTVATLDGNK